MNEDKSARYHRLKRNTSILSVAWSAALLVALLATGLATSLRDVLQSAIGSPAAVVLLYILVLVLLHEPVSFLLGWYSGYALEQRYGLSRQSFGGWLRDYAKGTVLSAVLAAGAGSLVYWTMRTWPEWWWVIAAAALTALLVLLVNLAPVLLLPLFFRFTPLDRPALRERLERLAERAGTRIVGVYRWDLGEKTTKANAALTGLGRTRRILLADTMLDHYSDDEIEVVMAHEMAHHVYHDIWSGIAVETVLVVLGFFTAHVVLTTAGPALGIGGVADPAGLPLLLLAAGAVSLVLLPLALALSRSHERRADRFALDLTGRPDAFISAMRRLGSQNLAEDRPSRIVEWLFHSHPPMHERLEAASRWSPPQ
jgi:STE24 endopeptidase